MKRTRSFDSDDEDDHVPVGAAASAAAWKKGASSYGSATTPVLVSRVTSAKDLERALRNAGASASVCAASWQRLLEVHWGPEPPAEEWWGDALYKALHDQYRDFMTDVITRQLDDAQRVVEMRAAYAMWMQAVAEQFADGIVRSNGRWELDAPDGRVVLGCLFGNDLRATLLCRDWFREDTMLMTLAEDVVDACATFANRRSTAEALCFRLLMEYTPGMYLRYDLDTEAQPMYDYDMDGQPIIVPYEHGARVFGLLNGYDMSVRNNVPLPPRLEDLPRLRLRLHLSPSSSPRSLESLEDLDDDTAAAAGRDAMVNSNDFNDITYL